MIPKQLNTINNFIAKYEKILGVVKQIAQKDNFLHQKRKPKLSDVEVIALSLAAECSGFESECHLFRNLPSGIEGKIDRSVYNRRRRALFPHYEMIRKEMSAILVQGCKHFVIDSMPWRYAKTAELHVLKYARTMKNRVLTWDIALVKRLTTSDINFMPFVGLMEFLQVLMLHPHQYTM